MFEDKIEGFAFAYRRFNRLAILKDAAQSILNSLVSLITLLLFPPLASHFLLLQALHVGPGSHFD